MDESALELIKEATYAPLERENGISPRDIIHEVQEAMAPCDYVFVKSEDRMQEALDIVTDAASKLGQMKVDNYHDLVKCIEAEAMTLGGVFLWSSMIINRKKMESNIVCEDSRE